MTGESGVEGEQGGWGSKASRPTGHALVLLAPRASLAPTG